MFKIRELVVDGSVEVANSYLSLGFRDCGVRSSPECASANTEHQTGRPPAAESGSGFECFAHLNVALRREYQTETLPLMGGDLALEKLRFGRVSILSLNCWERMHGQVRSLGGPSKIFKSAVGEIEMIAETRRKHHQDDKDRDERERRHQEKALDEALKNTFPASDPVSVGEDLKGIDLVIVADETRNEA